MTDLLTEAQVRARLRAAVEAAGSQRAWAREHGVHENHVSMTLRGARPPYRSILRALGLRAEKFTVYTIDKSRRAA